ncbi:MAG TPA: hypothetical protein VJ810_30250 [Blastocatellia bacterium]|nr:hypothetical protein [Blastocatellia bacterium]
MKQRVCFSLSVVCFMALLTVSALAQDQELQELNRKAVDKIVVQIEDAKIRAEMVKVIGEKIGFEMKVVKGAPYSAKTEVESVQALADGNRIRNKTTTLVYRDGEGRTRRESLGKAQNLPTEIFISDPATGVNYSLDTQRRVAVKSQVNLQELELNKTKLLYDLEMKRQTQESEQVAALKEKGSSSEKPQPITESLGQQLIEGVLCEGRRATTTIPAGAAGNELPINIVNEQWYSPELQVYVLTKQSDPRSGETIYRLTNINRSEPDRALFEVPADYAIKEQSALPLKKRRRPEEGQ